MSKKAFLSLLPIFALLSSFGYPSEHQGATTLRNPPPVRLELVDNRPPDAYDDPLAFRSPYNTRSKIYFGIRAINTSLAPLLLIISDPYLQDRPELFRAGDPVPYRKGLEDLLKAKEKDPYMRMSQSVTLGANEGKLIGYIFVKDWFGSLTAGHYQLTLKHRFELGQDWVESSSITFEVQPKE